MLRIFEYLFLSSGVLRKEVMKQSEDVFEQALDTENPDLAVNVISCLTGAIVSSSSVNLKATPKVLALIKRHRDFAEMPPTGSAYVKEAFGRALKDDLLEENFKME